MSSDLCRAAKILTYRSLTWALEQFWLDVFPNAFNYSYQSGRTTAHWPCIENLVSDHQDSTFLSSCGPHWTDSGQDKANLQKNGDCIFGHIPVWSAVRWRHVDWPHLLMVAFYSNILMTIMLRDVAVKAITKLDQNVWTKQFVPILLSSCDLFASFSERVLKRADE